ncbi:hypothetical protein ACVWXQ_006689 [Bradyrhizobium sp. S3.14.4]
MVIAMTDEIEALRDKFAEFAEKAEAELSVLPLAHIWPQIERLVVAMAYASPERRSDAVERFIDDIGDYICDARARLQPNYGERHPPPRRLAARGQAEPPRIGFNATLRGDDQE